MTASSILNAPCCSCGPWQSSGFCVVFHNIDARRRGISAEFSNTCFVQKLPPWRHKDCLSRREQGHSDRALTVPDHHTWVSQGRIRGVREELAHDVHNAASSWPNSRKGPVRQYCRKRNLCRSRASEVVVQSSIHFIYAVGFPAIRTLLHLQVRRWLLCN